MVRARIARLAVVALLGVAMLTVVGCQEKVAEVTSAWPIAEAERTVAEPPVPLRWPYTGKDAPSEKDIHRRPLSVKIENSPSARPQVGLNSADVVYETITEGGITRFNAVFHSKVPKTLGPVRSARLSDMWIVPQYDGLFFFSGTSPSVSRAVRRQDLPDLSQDAGISYPYWRSRERSAPHNLMLDTSKAYKEAKKRKYRTTADLQSFQFDRRKVEATPTVASIAIPFSQANSVKWKYDEDSNTYKRWNNGAVHRDQATGKQISADNVVVLWVKYTAAAHDMVGSTTYDVTLGGEGRATVFRNGQRYNATWVATRDNPPRFKDKEGRPVRLNVGRTWYQVIPLDGKVTMK